MLPFGLFVLTGISFAADCGTSKKFSDNTDHVIGVDACRNSAKLGSVTMDNRIEYISDSAFRDCKKLSSVQWSSNLLEIANRAFSGCAALTSITFPSKLRVISTFAFFGLPNLASVQFPESLRVCDVSFGNSPKMVMSFVNTTGTATFGVWKSYYLLTDNYTRLMYATPRSSTTMDLPSTCTVINGYSCVFSQCGPALVIPNTIQSIGDFAFESSTVVTSVKIGSGTVSIGSRAFINMKSLANLYVDSGNSVFSEEGGVIYDKNKTCLQFYPGARTSTTLSLPRSIESFGLTPFGGSHYVEKFTFVSGSAATSVTITPDGKSLLGEGGKVLVRTVPNHKSAAYRVPDGVERIAPGAFSQTAIGAVTLPNSCTELGSRAFYESKLTGINLNQIKTVGGNIFEGSKILRLDVPNWTTIPAFFIYVGPNLATLTIAEGVEVIGSHAFAGCAMTSLKFPSTLRRIEYHAFRETKLTTITLPANLEYIGPGAFLYASAATSVTIPSHVAYVDSRAFALGSFTSIYLENCGTGHAHDAFLAASDKTVQVKCDATRVFTNAVWINTHMMQPEIVKLLGMLHVTMLNI